MNLMDSKAVDAATDIALNMGVRVFNGALFGDNEVEHVAVLLEMLDPPENALIIDAGCGVGEMARLMREARPDLGFLLVNTSEHQLALCPDEFDRLVASYEDMAAVPDHTADAIIFSFSLCHAAFWSDALKEARRVLKPGGTIMVNDMAALGDTDPALIERVLGARFWHPAVVEQWLRNAGLMLTEALAPDVGVNRLAELLQGDGVDLDLDGLVPTIWLATAVDEEAAPWVRHAGRIAFQYSGGRDSTAALYLLRDRWPEMRVYHVDTGDQFPELRAVVAEVEAELLDAGVELVRIETDVKAQREREGYPSDLIPVSNTALGRMVSGEPLKLTGRFDCCANALMLPLHTRMAVDGISMLVRGQRDEEYAGGAPTRHGDVLDGFELHYPLQGWTAERVQAYLEDNGLPVAPFYRAGMKRAPECMGCTAWWDEGRLEYMRDRYPVERAVVMMKMHEIRNAVTAQLNEMEA